MDHLRLRLWVRKAIRLLPSSPLLLKSIFSHFYLSIVSHFHRASEYCLNREDEFYADAHFGLDKFHHA